MTGKVTMGGSLGKSLLSILAGLLVAGIIMQVSGYNPWQAFSALWQGATGLHTGTAAPNDLSLGAGKFAIHLNRYNLAQSLSKMTPLLLCGLSVGLGLRAGLFNIGAQGQMLAGALAGGCVGFIGAPNGTPSASRNSRYWSCTCCIGCGGTCALVNSQLASRARAMSKPSFTFARTIRVIMPALK